MGCLRLPTAGAEARLAQLPAYEAWALRMQALVLYAQLPGSAQGGRGRRQTILWQCNGRMPSSTQHSRGTHLDVHVYGGGGIRGRGRGGAAFPSKPMRSHILTLLHQERPSSHATAPSKQSRGSHLEGWVTGTDKSARPLICRHLGSEQGCPHPVPNSAASKPSMGDHHHRHAAADDACGPTQKSHTAAGKTVTNKCA